MNAEILSVGTELLLGNIVNTDARDLAVTLSELGINVFWQTVVGDNRERLTEAVNIARRRADLIITTGGTEASHSDIVYQALSGEGVRFEDISAQPGRSQGWGTITVAGRVGIEGEEPTRDVQLVRPAEEREVASARTTAANHAEKRKRHAEEAERRNERSHRRIVDNRPVEPGEEPRRLCRERRRETERPLAEQGLKDRNYGTHAHRWFPCFPEA